MSNNFRNLHGSIITELLWKFSKVDVELRRRILEKPAGSFVILFKKPKTINAITFMYDSNSDDLGEIHFQVRLPNHADNIKSYYKTNRIVKLTEKEHTLNTAERQAFINAIFDYLMAGAERTIEDHKLIPIIPLRTSAKEKGFACKNLVPNGYVGMAKIKSLNFKPDGSIDIYHEAGMINAFVEDVWGLECVTPEHYIFINNLGDINVMRKNKASYLFDMTKYFEEESLT
jgi:hypothetical protein